MPASCLSPARRAAGLVALGWLALASAAFAQDTTQVRPPSDTLPRVRLDVPASQDTVPEAARRPIGPMGAFWRSALVPGWGQARLDRKLAAAGFIAVEGIMLGMTLKATNELRYLEGIGDTTRASAKRAERQDWLVLLAFNHLLAGIEAYVSSHLWDFPGDLELRRMPNGGVGAEARIPVRFP
ncbi:MAG: hypothetical protein ACOY71_06800 [Gemmatimonadota bacterium]